MSAFRNEPWLFFKSLKVLHGWAQDPAREKVILDEFSHFEKGDAMFFNVDYTAESVGPDTRTWWQTVGTEALHLFADWIFSLRCANQASEHGWAHLGRQSTFTRYHLDTPTQRALMNVMCNSEILLEKEAPVLR